MMIVPKPFVILCILLGSTRSATVDLPPWLKLGVASSAYQVEGSWNVSDKGESIVDRFMHWPFTPNAPESVLNGENGDIAADSYRLWERDLEMLGEVGVDFYRFSISWARLLPESGPHYISEDGKNYYNNLINGMLEIGVEPVVTLHHFDLPQKLQDLGGWTNPLIVDWFGNYARTVYSLFGDRVKTWITINEPVIICELAYTTGMLAPGVIEPDYGPYLCDKHVMLAHARAWRIYDEEFKPLYGGKVSLSNHLLWLKPQTEEDEDITELAWEYVVGRYSHPIYSEEGGWPPIYEKYMEELSYRQGYNTTKLQLFTPEEIKYVKGAYDFYGMNHYTVRLARSARPDDDFGWVFYFGIEKLNVIFELDPSWPLQYGDLFATHPESLREELVFLKQKYGDMEFFITENGYISDGAMDDLDRCEYLNDHLEQIVLTTNEDKVHVTGYTFWSLMDSMEWLDGYFSKFGLYHTDFEDPERTRTPRTSAQFYADIIKNRTIEV